MIQINKESKESAITVENCDGVIDLTEKSHNNEFLCDINKNKADYLKANTEASSQIIRFLEKWLGRRKKKCDTDNGIKNSKLKRKRSAYKIKSNSNSNSKLARYYDEEEEFDDIDDFQDDDEYVDDFIRE